MAGSIAVEGPVAIATGPSRRSRAFPGVQSLADGSLFLAFREGTDHLITDDGAIYSTRSRDLGRSWEVPQPLFEEPGWDLAGGNRLAAVGDGSLLMFVIQARWRKHQTGLDPKDLPDSLPQRMSQRETHVRIMRSRDAGHSWKEFGPEPGLFRSWTEVAARGEIHVLSDGRYMVPAYGADDSGGRTKAIVAFSSDEGRTWGGRRSLAANHSVGFHEADIVRRKDGTFLAVVRSLDPPFDLFQTQSADEGTSWSRPARVGLRGQAPALLLLDSGVLLCVYRDRDPGRAGVTYATSSNDGESWQIGGTLYVGNHWNCGYPSLAPLPNGEVFCAYYTSYGERGSEVLGVFLKP
jgi:hypothetical protein